jgi:hypothetical protein
MSWRRRVPSSRVGSPLPDRFCSVQSKVMMIFEEDHGAYITSCRDNECPCDTEAAAKLGRLARIWWGRSSGIEVAPRHQYLKSATA